MYGLFILEANCPVTTRLEVHASALPRAKKEEKSDLEGKVYTTYLALQIAWPPFLNSIRLSQEP